MKGCRPSRVAIRLSALLTWVVAGLLCALFCPEGTLSAQSGMGGDCDIPSFARMESHELEDGSRLTLFTSPVIVCDQGTRILADSASVQENANLTRLFRNVVFEDEDSRLTATDSAYYRSDIRRLVAWRNVVLNDLVDGSIIRGDTIVLLRAGGGRAEDQLTVTGRRPHATLYPALQPLAPEVEVEVEVDEEEITDPAEEMEEVAPPDSGQILAPDSAGVEAMDSVGAPVQDSAAAQAMDSVVAPVQDSGAVQAMDSVGVLVQGRYRLWIRYSAAAQALDSVGVPVQDSAAAQAMDSVRAPVLDSAEATDPDSIPPMLPERSAPAPPAPQPTVEPEERTPYQIMARRIFLEGARYFRATGEVTIDRDSLNAAADSVEYDEMEGALFLAGEAKLITDAFDLSSDNIRLDIPQDEVRSVLAREQAVLEGDDLWLLAPTISILMNDGAIDQLVAVGDPPNDSLPEEENPVLPPHPVAQELGLIGFPLRPHAFTDDFLLWADSIEVHVPEDVLDEVWAMGNARGESLARDSLNTPDTHPLVRRDWVEGDTIVAFFVPNDDSSPHDEGGDPEAEAEAPELAGGRESMEAESDSTGYRMERMVARVGAKSLYRMAASDSTTNSDSTAASEPGSVSGEERPAYHYVIGEEITIFMEDGEVERMEVSGTTRGWHLEPVVETRRGSGEGTVVPPPATTPPDTTGIQRSTRGGMRP